MDETQSHFVVRQRFLGDIIDRLSQKTVDKIGDFRQLDIVQVFHIDIIPIEHYSVFGGLPTAVRLNNNFPRKRIVDNTTALHTAISFKIIQGFNIQYVGIIVQISMFCEKELSLVRGFDQKEYKIGQYNKVRGNKMRVRWLGYGREFDFWISISDVET